ncbi:hypothetical protein C1I99_03740 [Micromonospora deserti]|uniref:Uncharacterized protein n=1 Tax=Micromonospora deserti TaxID=2070366 RepID=A0A2W2EBM5_9ACTN|nr:hypothetical protein C1I99_03740 [Micromonospora deserti]
MVASVRVVPRRVLWHPLTLTAAVAIASATAAATYVSAAGAGTVGSLWLVMAVTAGFATSGSV